MNIAFLDLEFTRKPYDSTFINEIIEISCLTYPIEDSYELSDDNYIISNYKFGDKKSNKLTMLVKPTINTFLTKEISQYTGISQRKLDDEGIQLEEAINNIYTHIRKNDIVRIYIYSRYSKDLLSSAKRILRGRLDKKIDYILNLIKDISYYSNIARDTLAKSLVLTNNYEVKYSKEKLINKKKFSLNDTYMILMNEKEIRLKAKTKSLSDSILIKDIFFSDFKSVKDELNEIAYRIELKRERLYSYIESKREMIEWVCSATSSEDLKKYRHESLEQILKSMVYIIREFKFNIIANKNIEVSNINVNDKWLTIYESVLGIVKKIKKSYGLKVKSVKDCIDILVEKEKEKEMQNIDANAISILMESGDNLEIFKKKIATLDKEMINVLIEKCKKILSEYNHGHAFRIYTSKLNILSNTN